MPQATDPTAAPAAITIAGRSIGPGHPCFLAVEVGTTCLGEMDRALRLVHAAAAAGVDAVKFQVIDPTQISDPTVTYTFRSGGQSYTVNMKEMFERLCFSRDQWRDIADACADAGVLFYATVDYLDGVDMMESIGVPCHKIGAWDTTFKPLIERIGATGKPLFVDLGPTTQEEADDLVGWHQGAGGGPVLFLHDFHTGDDGEMNLRAVQHLNARYPWPAGFSAPGRDDDLDFAALALGAAHLEKRLILSRRDPAFHADESLEPDELAAWVQRIRHVERALGRAEIVPSRVDREQSRDYYRSICTLRPVAAGEAFGPDNLGGKRPGTGLPTARLNEFWGRRAATDLAADTLIGEEHLA
ncbi:MAG: N-acetylneuraminate synthase family protein [Hyphomicrobiales bacterium]|nr:N-acetylneuraminate synthase family protein [Hyphomicrobiales bacterium]